MKVDVTRVLHAINGEVLKDGEDDATLRMVSINALMNQLEEDKNQTGEQKVKAHALATRLFNEDEPDLQAEEVSLLKDRVGKSYGPAVVGPAFALLDPKEPA